MSSTRKWAIDPNWDEIEQVSSESIEFLSSNHIDEDTVQMFNMVICELVENSLKYGDFSSSEKKVDIEVSISKKMATVEVRNLFRKEMRPHLERLDKTIQWIRGFQDPFQAYLEKLKEISRKPLDDEESGLGLARIAYEGQAIIDFFVGDDDQLNVSAVSDIE